MNLSFKGVLALSGVAFGVTLALVIGTRLEPAALAVMVGVGCGVGASVPTSLLVWNLIRGRGRESRLEPTVRQERYAAWGGASPPVVVISPSAGTPSLLPMGDSFAQREGAGDERYTYTTPTMQRQFSVIGEGEDDDFQYQGQ